MKLNWLKDKKFHSIINLPEKVYIHDFSQGEDPLPDGFQYSIGKYNEDRRNMYTTDLFLKDKRSIHIGIDIAAPVGDDIFNFYDGVIKYVGNNTSPGDYGPTLVLEYDFNGNKLYALFGHLSLESIVNKSEGQRVKGGEVIGAIGDREVNGGWFPHVHFQLSLIDPGKADMPGVVSAAQLKQALMDYPDPSWVTGNLY